MSDLQQRMYEALDSACKCTDCQAAAAVLIAEDAVRDLAAKVEAVVLKWSCPPLENRGNTLVLRDLRNLLADAQTPATSHAAGTGAANGASVDAETRDGGAGL